MFSRAGKLEPLAASVALLVLAVSAPSQEKTATLDPELATIIKAERDGRVADADKLLTAAIQDADRNPAQSRRMSLLLNHLASLRFRQGRTLEAIAAAQRAISLDEEIYGPESNHVAGDLSSLGVFCAAAREDDAAEQAYGRGLTIARQNPGPRAETLLMLLNNLSEFYDQRGRTAEAQALIEEALQACGKERLDPAPTSCSGFRRRLAASLRREGRESAAEGIVSDSVAADPESGRQWRTRVVDLHTLAQQYEQDNSFDLAESAYRQAIELIEKNSDSKHPPWPVQEFISLGGVLHKEGRDLEAEDYFKRALEMQEQAAGPERPELARFFPVFDLTNLYREEGRLGEMEPILRQWLTVQERALGADHIELADTLLELARICEEEQEYTNAEPLFRRALAIQEANLGPDDPKLIGTLDEYSEVLRKMGQSENADEARARAETLRRKNSPPPGPAKQPIP